MWGSSQALVLAWLATRAQTIFHHRGNTESLGGVLHEMLSRHGLRFPEGVLYEDIAVTVPAASSKDSTSWWRI